jgi:hypothetical protein
MRWHDFRFLRRAGPRDECRLSRVKRKPPGQRQNDPFENPKVPILRKTILVEWHSVWFDHKNELDAG